jgi:hypothetical protein
VSSVNPCYYLASSGRLDRGQLSRWVAVMDRFSERHFSRRAGKHYGATWALCTDEEKLMLVQLAQGALVNPNGEVALRQLLWKGLIKKAPYRIADAEFQAFVRSAQPAGRVEMGARGRRRLAYHANRHCDFAGWDRTDPVCGPAGYPALFDSLHSRLGRMAGEYVKGA